MTKTNFFFQNLSIQQIKKTTVIRKAGFTSISIISLIMDGQVINTVSLHQASRYVVCINDVPMYSCICAVELQRNATRLPISSSKITVRHYSNHDSLQIATSNTLCFLFAKTRFSINQCLYFSGTNR